MEATPAFAGIDWSWQHHTACIIDAAGHRIARYVAGDHQRPPQPQGTR